MGHPHIAWLVSIKSQYRLGGDRQSQMRPVLSDDLANLSKRGQIFILKLSFGECYPTASMYWPRKSKPTCSEKASLSELVTGPGIFC